MIPESEAVGLGWNDSNHGDHCDCRALAAAVGAGPEAVNLNYCRHVLQRHWRLTCNHGGRFAGKRETPQLPPIDPRDPVQAMLLANARPG
jgi:hypothetical protein